MSMLTRYRPKIWTDIVNVDTSAHAVPTEFVLDAALDSVPDLLAYALDDAPHNLSGVSPTGAHSNWRSGRLGCDE